MNILMPFCSKFILSFLCDLICLGICFHHFCLLKKSFLYLIFRCRITDQLPCVQFLVWYMNNLIKQMCHTFMNFQTQNYSMICLIFYLTMMNLFHFCHHSSYFFLYFHFDLFLPHPLLFLSKFSHFQFLILIWDF